MGWYDTPLWGCSDEERVATDVYIIELERTVAAMAAENERLRRLVHNLEGGSSRP